MSFILGSLQNESVLCLICHKFSKTQNPKVLSFAEKNPTKPKARGFNKIKEPANNMGNECTTKGLPSVVVPETMNAPSLEAGATIPYI
jgi:hypothetical protein